MIWAALSMTAALVMTACTNDDNIVETPAAPQAEVKTIPYSVTVSQGGDATTRATVDDDMKTLRFAAGDKLYIQSGDRTDLKGILTLKAGDEGKTSGATFEGTISYEGDAPADGIGLNATLVGTSNVNFDIVKDKVVGGIPSSAYYDDVKEAVEEYSYLTGMSSYGEKEFTLVQIMAFLNFEITFEDGTAAGTTLNTVVSNGGLYPDPYCSANVTTKTEGGKVVAKFVLPVAAGATLSGATVKMGDKAALTIKDATLEGKVYNVKRTYARTLAEATAEDIGKVAGADGKIYTNVAAAKAASTTACAIIAYVGSATGEASPYNHGLAIAMKDAAADVKWSSSNKDETLTNFETVNLAVTTAQSGLSNSQTSGFDDVSNYPAFYAALHNTITASDGISADAPASGTSGWFLPSLYQWNMIVKGLSGKTTNLSFSDNDDYKASSLNTKIAAAGGTGLQPSGYWSSTEYNGSRARFFGANFGSVNLYNKGDADLYVRSAFAF